MSVLIVGGNEGMVREYINLCDKYNCKAKVFCKMSDGLKSKIGRPDLMVLFTNTTSHKMIRFALNEVKGQSTTVARCHSSSMSALKNILNEHTKEDLKCPRN